jgi:hypothetical protein
MLSPLLLILFLFDRSSIDEPVSVKNSAGNFIIITAKIPLFNMLSWTLIQEKSLPPTLD